MTIAMNGFARRQTAGSRFSHFNGDESTLLALTLAAFEAGKVTAGYRDGVLLVSVAPEGFYSGVVKVTSETVLVSVLMTRRPGEEAYVETCAKGGAKLEAGACEIVLYSHAALNENGEKSDTDADFEIVSVNARETVGPEPMTPVAMSRNQRAAVGGTPATYSPEAWADAVHYWSTRAMLAP